MRLLLVATVYLSTLIGTAFSQFRSGAEPNPAVATPPAPGGDDAVTVTKRDKRSVLLTGLSAADAQVLTRDLMLSGVFTMAAGPESAEFVVDGRSGGDLQARLTARTGAELFARTYGGGTRERVHRLADDIVEALGRRGFAASKLAFVGTRSGKKEIYTCDADGAKLVQLTRDGVLSVSPSLSLDGRHLLYTGYQSGYPDVYRIDLSSGGRSRIIKFPGTNSGATFSPDLSRIAVTLSKDGNPELYVTNASGGGPRRLTRTRGVESSPSWSPDGSQIVYSNDDGGAPMLYRISADGGTPSRIDTGAGYNTEPSWSPDGSKIAWTQRGGGSFQIGVVALDSGRVRTIGSGQDPAWSPNSRHLVCTDGSSLILIDSQTGQQTALLGGVGKISEPTWSR